MGIYPVEELRRRSRQRHCGSNESLRMTPARPIPASTTQPIMLERHYSVRELSDAWGVSANTVRRIFEQEAGVLRIGKSFRRGRRGYVTIRIPESVVARVHQRGTV